MKRRPPRLAAKLEELATRYDRRFLGSDPVLFAHRFESRDDREIAAFVASALAYGSVKQILGSAGRVLAALIPGGTGAATTGDLSAIFKDTSLASQRPDFNSFMKKGDERLRMLEQVDRLPDLQPEQLASPPLPDLACR